MNFAERLLKSNVQTVAELEIEAKNVRRATAYEDRYGIEAYEDPLFNERIEEFNIYFSNL